jgi:ATP-dependent Clp protease adaptor protein ClpS
MSPEAGLPETAVITRPKERHQRKERRIPPYHVILENDDYHSFDFVVGVLRKALGYSEERASLLTQEADATGRAVVWTGPREVAELKAEQIRTFHEICPETNLPLGPLGCTIEPAPGG